MSLVLTHNVARPNYNTTSGRSVKVTTNHYKIKTLPSAIIQQWDVKFITEKPLPKSKAAAMQKSLCLWNLPAVQEEFAGKVVIFNGAAVAYSCEPLPFEQIRKVIDEKSGTVLQMSKTTTIHPECLQQFLLKRYAYDEKVAEAITFINALLADGPRQNFSTICNNSQYFKASKSRQDAQNANVSDIGGNVELWRGIFQSARPGPGYMTINVDVAHTTFYKPHITIIDLLVGNLHLSGPQAIAKLQDNPERKKDAAKLLHGLGVYTSHTKRQGGRTEKIFSVLWKQTPTTYKFEKDGKMITISQYFKSVYNINLQYPALPLLEMNGGKSRVPMELCKVADGQRFPNALLTGDQTSCIVAQAARPPGERFACIKDNVQTLNWSGDRSLVHFGLQASPEMIQTNARVLDSPTIAYREKATVKPKDGKWMYKGKKLVVGVILQSWGILNLSRDDTSRFEQQLVSSGKTIGISFKAAEPFKDSANAVGDLPKIIKTFFTSTGNHFNQRPQIIFIILPRGDYYGEIKLACDTLIGVPSQCIASSKLRKANGQYCENVWLKANIKVGGCNTKLVHGSTSSMPDGTLLLGADVSHPTAGALAGGKPSIASLVSSTDATASKFVGQARSQAARQEIIDELDRMTLNAISNWQPKSNLKSIVYYRDGVGENQFPEIREKELSAIKRACVKAGVNPKVTIVICQKRHHTRLFPPGQNMNVQPGTIVDNDITHPTDFDFYLVAHHSFKGTARPTHYQVIYDENKFKAENLQRMTHDMCYSFVRSTTSVSIVPVAYYAHLVGNRVKEYCKGESESGSSGDDAAPEPSSLLTPLHISLRATMWYV